MTWSGRPRPNKEHKPVAVQRTATGLESTAYGVGAGHRPLQKATFNAMYMGPLRLSRLFLRQFLRQQKAKAEPIAKTL